LQKLRLIHLQQTESGYQFIDAHPLIREHFAQLLKGGEAWREGHRRIYEYLRDTTNEGDKPSLKELLPLYQAVAHGCHAGMQQEACVGIYEARILKTNEHYSWRKLGMFGSDLG